jgi:hypothetical protein
MMALSARCANRTCKFNELNDSVTLPVMTRRYKSRRVFCAGTKKNEHPHEA